MNDFFSGLFGHSTFAVILGAVLLSSELPEQTAPVPAEETEMIARAATSPSDLADLSGGESDQRIQPIVSTSLPQIVPDAETTEAEARIEVASFDPAQDSAADAPSNKTIRVETLGASDSGTTLEPPVGARPADAASQTVAAVAPAEQVERFGVITGNSVNLRAGPSTDYGKVGRVSKGDIVEFTDQRNGEWVEIVDPDSGQRVWMHGNYIDALS